MRRKIFLVLPLILFSLGFNNFHSRKESGKEVKTEAITGGGFTNLYKIDSVIYRSEQPTKEGFTLIQQLGIKTIINLRQHHTDKELVKNSSIIAKQFPINTWKISYEDVLKVLRAIKDSEKPVLIHCKHGSDRTGCIIAAYRMVYEDVPKEEAINEFENKMFGYHKGWFPNILDLLNSLDVNKLKSDLEKN